MPGPKATEPAKPTQKPVAKAAPSRPEPVKAAARPATGAKPAQVPRPVTPAAMVEVAKPMMEAMVDAAAATTSHATKTAAKAAEAMPKAAEAAARTAPRDLPEEAPAPFKGLFIMAEKFTTPSFTPEHVQSMFGDMSERTKGAMEKSARMVEDMSDFAKGNVEAMMTSGRAAAKGAETVGQEFAEYSKKSFEGAAAAFKSFAAAKSPTELFKLQSDYAKSSFESAIAESSKLSEQMLKLFGEIAQPMSTRVAVAADKIKAPAL